MNLTTIELNNLHVMNTKTSAYVTYPYFLSSTLNLFNRFLKYYFVFDAFK